MTASTIYRTNWDHTSLMLANATGRWATNFAADLRHRRFNGDFGGYRRTGRLSVILDRNVGYHITVKTEDGERLFSHIEINCPSLDYVLDIVGNWMGQPDNVHMFAPVDLINN